VCQAALLADPYAARRQRGAHPFHQVRSAGKGLPWARNALKPPRIEGAAAPAPVVRRAAPVPEANQQLPPTLALQECLSPGLLRNGPRGGCPRRLDPAA